jgi:hypothetical protein
MSFLILFVARANDDRYALLRVARIFGVLERFSNSAVRNRVSYISIK